MKNLNSHTGWSSLDHDWCLCGLHHGLGLRIHGLLSWRAWCCLLNNDCLAGGTLCCVASGNRGGSATTAADDDDNDDAADNGDEDDDNDDRDGHSDGSSDGAAVVGIANLDLSHDVDLSSVVVNDKSTILLRGARAEEERLVGLGTLIEAEAVRAPVGAGSTSHGPVRAGNLGLDQEGELSGEESVALH